MRARRLAAVLLAAALVGLPFEGGAQAGTPQITVQASTTQVEVDEVFTIELKVMADQGDPQPSDIDLRPPREFNITGHSESSQMVVQQSGGGMVVQVGRRVVWQVVGHRPGRFTIPGPVVTWNTRRVAASPITIEVVPSTGRPRRQQQQQPNNPFLMPGGPGWGGFPFGNMFQDDEPVAAEPKTAPELSLPRAPDPSFFLHARLDKKNVVVGEQVTLGIYIYHRTPRSLSLIEQHDAPLPDFLRVPLTKTPGTDQSVFTTAGGQRYRAQLFDQMAIFPLHAGDLHIGQARCVFREGARNTTAERSSEDEVIHVTEPPRAGRPPGYTLGDVGQFSLSASVAPRKIDQGGEVSVTLRLAGTGNLPQSLRVPERTGVEWLDPEKKESIEPQNGVVGGWRTFGYVVRIKDSGTVDLGEVTLPYWDPASGRYQVARASLGTIEVNPVAPRTDPATQKPVDQAAPDPFVSMPGVRTSLGTYTPARPPRLDGTPLWLLLAAPPLAVGMVSAGAGAARRARARRAQASGSPAVLAQKALADAKDAEASGDTAALVAALERALHLSVESATGLKSRGVLVAELPAELEERGLPRELADRIAAALATCDKVRFEPAPDTSTTRDLAAQVRGLAAELGRRKAS